MDRKYWLLWALVLLIPPFVMGYRGVSTRDEVVFSENIVSPVVVSSGVWFKSPFAFTVTGIDCIVDPSETSDAISITINECDGTGDGCNPIEAAITCGNGGAAHAASIDAPNIEAGNWISVTYGTPSGTVGRLGYTMKGTRI